MTFVVDLAQSTHFWPTGVSTEHCGQIGLLQDEHRRRVSLFGWR
jgi:hypothetical protein